MMDFTVAPRHGSVDYCRPVKVAVSMDDAKAEAIRTVGGLSAWSKLSFVEKCDETSAALLKLQGV